MKEWKHTTIQNGGDKYRHVESDAVIIKLPGTLYRAFIGNRHEDFSTLPVAMIHVERDSERASYSARKRG
jgi:hypothetical protein